MENALIKYQLKITQSLQKSYSNVRMRDLEFEADDWVFLKVFPMKRVMRFDKKGKLSSQYVGSCRYLSGIRRVAYELELPMELAVVHPVFYVSMLKKCVGNPSLIVSVEVIRVKDIQFRF